MILDENFLTFLYFLFFVFFLFVHLSIIFRLILKKKIFFGYPCSIPHYKIYLIFLIIMIKRLILIINEIQIFLPALVGYKGGEKFRPEKTPTHLSLVSSPCRLHWGQMYSGNCVLWMPQYTLLCSLCTLDASVHFILQLVYFGCLSTFYSVACVLWMPQYTLFCSLCTLDVSVHFTLQLVYFGCLSTFYSVACVLWMPQYILLCSLCTVK